MADFKYEIDDNGCIVENQGKSYWIYCPGENPLMVKGVDWSGKTQPELEDAVEMHRMEDLL